MSTAAERAREKAARLAASGSGRRIDNQGVDVPEEPVEAVPPSGSRAASTATIRTTLDLAPALHEGFDDWARSTQRELRDLKLGRQVKAKTLRVLLRRLLSDPELSQWVKDELKREGMA